MSETIHCVRAPAGSSSSALTVDVSAYRVFLVLLGRFASNPDVHRRLKDATTARLREIFTRVAEVETSDPRAQSRAIDLVWASVSELSARRPNECIVYFVQSYDDGIIHHYASTMVERSADHRDYYAELESEYVAGSTHAGLTLEDRDRAPVHVLSEVHISQVMRNYPDATNAGLTVERRQGHIDSAGVGLGGMAFHELMHNVVDLNRERGFNLHTQGGMAAANGYTAAPTSANLRAFRQFMFSDSPPQIIPSGPGPRIAYPPRRAAEGSESGGSGPDLSGALQGL